MAFGGGLSALIPPKKKPPGTSPGAPPTPLPAHEHGWPHRDSFREQVAAARQVSRTSDESRDRDRAPGRKTGEPPRREESVFHIEIEKIRPNPYQPRRTFNDEELRELADSIRGFGIIQPLVVSKTVRELPSGTEVEYQLIAGERRLLAAKLAGLERVPAIVRQVDTHRAKLELALIENIQRSDLNPIEAARAYTRLQDEFGLTQREVAERVGKSRESVANTMRLLNLPPKIQDALARKIITESHARSLLALPDPASQLRAFEAPHPIGTAVRSLRTEAPGPRAVEADPEVAYWARKLEESIGSPVKITRRGEKGKITIRFFSEESWRAIVERFVGQDE